MSRSDDYLDEFKQVLEHIVQSEKDREGLPRRKHVRDKPQPKHTQNSKVGHSRKSFVGLVAIQTALMVGAFFFVRDYFGDGVVARTITRNFEVLTAPRTEGGPFKRQPPVEVAITDSNNQTELFKDDPIVVKTATRKAKPLAIANVASSALPRVPKSQEVIQAPKTLQVRTTQQLAALVPSPIEVPLVVETKALALLPSPTIPAPQKVLEKKPSFAPDSTFRDCANCPEMSQSVGRADQPALGLHEVTFTEWDACVDDGGCKTRPSDNGWGGGDRPVINVSYTMIVSEYLPWLSRKAKARYRLPTEAEWNAFAQRAGGSAGQKGNLLPTDETVPVTSLPANNEGVSGLLGNVWEWVDDCRTVGFVEEKINTPCSHRIVRGGAWSSKRENLNIEARGWESVSKTSNAIGFRVLRELDQAVGEVISP